MSSRPLPRMLIALAAFAVLSTAALVTPAMASGIDLAKAAVLVAKRDLRDRLYTSTVLLVRPLGNDRHVGVIINKPTQMTLAKLFPNHPPSQKIVDPVFLGGPIGSEVIFAL